MNDLDDIEKGIRARQLRGMFLPQTMIYTEDELLMKADKNEFNTEEREKLAKKKMAMHGGEYPIRNKSDLTNAIQSFGRAKDPQKVKRWIVKRAKELNCVENLPDSWNIKKAEADTIFEIETSIEKGLTNEDIYNFPKLNEIIKGKKFPIGTVKKWGENEYEKTNGGWKLVKKQGKEYKETKSTNKDSKNSQLPKDIESFLSKFPDNATSWKNATDEIRDISRTAKEYYNELDLGLSGDKLHETNALNFRELKTPSDWNTKGKQHINNIYSKMSDNTKKQFLESIERWTNNKEKPAIKEVDLKKVYDAERKGILDKQDVKDIEVINDMIKENHIEAAKKSISNLDTHVRDYFPRL
jgi:hypothetical protein